MLRSIYDVRNGGIAVINKGFYTKSAFFTVYFFHRNGFKQGNDRFVNGRVCAFFNFFAQKFFLLRSRRKSAFKLYVFIGKPF